MFDRIPTRFAILRCICSASVSIFSVIPAVFKRSLHGTWSFEVIECYQEAHVPTKKTSACWCNGTVLAQENGEEVSSRYYLETDALAT
jgi:hypothetical protein